MKVGSVSWDDHFQYMFQTTNQMRDFCKASPAPAAFPRLISVPFESDGMAARCSKDVSFGQHMDQSGPDEKRDESKTYIT